MVAVGLTAEWAALAAPLHRRSAGRPAHVVVGILLAHGRRTVAVSGQLIGVFTERDVLFGDH